MAKTIKLYTDLENGKTKEYKAKKLSSLYIMQAMRLGAKLEKAGEDFDISMIEDLLDLIVDVYNEQFTKDELLAGIASEDFMTVLEQQLVMIASPEVDSAETKDFLAKKEN
ncbi:phage tail assembly chaperone G [Macrococcus carouselicus]|uniref:Phage tail protein n=1 Tax=Macrococcus carouselicus TaxID=69969 RepID=A0A9Q8CJQ5_9STAP|nr:hypothetical protein [Macrococcus carouselicus]TDM04068.1 hypothetical protein ERX40_02550 [Macrococcus carouselicus]